MGGLYCRTAIIIVTYRNSMRSGCAELVKVYLYSPCSGFGKKSWFVAEEIDGCSSSGERCFGCCYDYPTEPYGCNCSKLLDITLTCSKLTQYY